MSRPQRRAILRGSQHTEDPLTTDLGVGGGHRWIEFTCGHVVKFANPWPEVGEELLCLVCDGPVFVRHRWTVPTPDMPVLQREEDFATFAASLGVRNP